MDWLNEIEQKVDPRTGRSPAGHLVVSGHTLCAAEAVKLIAAVRMAEKAIETASAIIDMSTEWGPTTGSIRQMDAWEEDWGRRHVDLTGRLKNLLAQLKSGEFGEGQSEGLSGRTLDGPQKG